MSFFTKTQKFNGVTSKHVEYYMNEDEAFIYLNHFYINPEEDKVTCLAKCGNQGENMRIPEWKRKLFAQRVKEIIFKHLLLQPLYHLIMKINLIVKMDLFKLIKIRI